MKRNIKVIDGKNIFLNGMKKAGIEIPKNDAEFKSLLGDIKNDFAKMEKKNK